MYIVTPSDPAWSQLLLNPRQWSALPNTCIAVFLPVLVSWGPPSGGCLQFNIPRRTHEVGWHYIVVFSVPHAWQLFWDQIRGSMRHDVEQCTVPPVQKSPCNMPTHTLSTWLFWTSQPFFQSPTSNHFIILSLFWNIHVCNRSVH